MYRLLFFTFLRKKVLTICYISLFVWQQHLKMLFNLLQRENNLSNVYFYEQYRTTEQRMQLLYYLKFAMLKIVFSLRIYEANTNIGCICFAYLFTRYVKTIPHYSCHKLHAKCAVKVKMSSYILRGWTLHFSITAINLYSAKILLFSASTTAHHFAHQIYGHYLRKLDSIITSIYSMHLYCNIKL